jgi:transposase InsO family protein/DNA-binding transcriptional regulator YiaG
MANIPYTDRVLLRAMKPRFLETFALTALRRATSLLGLAIGTRIGELRCSDDPMLNAAGKLEEQAVLLRLHEELRDIVAARWDKVPAKHRPHYTPEQRFRILRAKELLALSRSEVARIVRVEPETIANWEAERSSNPDHDTVGSTVRPRPPVRRFADVVRALVQAMGVAGFGGDETIAMTLARAGWKLSKRTVGRIRKEKPVASQPDPDHPTPPDPEPKPDTPRAVTARRPNHVRMIDFTEVPGLFRIVVFRLITAMDVFSRMPLAADLTSDEPTAADVVRVLRAANHNHGPADHLITDQGSQFTSREFHDACASVGTKQRFGAIGKSGSIALIERLWRTIKALGALRSRPPLTVEDFRRRAELTLRHYAYCRPHRALSGATPAEVFFGIEPAYLRAASPPRALPGKGPGNSPFAITYLDDERRLPLLYPKAA